MKFNLTKSQKKYFSFWVSCHVILQNLHLTSSLVAFPSTQSRNFSEFKIALTVLSRWFAGVVCVCVCVPAGAHARTCNAEQVKLVFHFSKILVDTSAQTFVILYKSYNSPKLHFWQALSWPVFALLPFFFQFPDSFKCERFI